jgi:anti-anti-sigma factor
VPSYARLCIKLSTMLFKIDTKEKFHVISLQEKQISASMAAELQQMLLDFLAKSPPNLVLKLNDVTDIADTAAEVLAQTQQQFYEESHSFVICEMQKNVEAAFEKLELLEVLNATPTESEAWDIVQMEEIERELLDDDQVEFEKD